MWSGMDVRDNEESRGVENFSDMPFRLWDPGFKGTSQRLQSIGKRLINTKVFKISILITNVINILAMMLYYDGIPDTLLAFIEFTNMACSIVYLIELLIKVTCLGCRDYFKEFLNVSDCIITLYSVTETIVTFTGVIEADNAYRIFKSF